MNDALPPKEVRPHGGHVLHYGRFLNTPARHGGTRRSEQLREVLQRAGMAVVPVLLASERHRSRLDRARGALRGIGISPTADVRRARKPAGLYHRAMADASIRDSPRHAPVVWESGPGEAFYGGWAAHRHGHRVVAVPQNFDSLTPDQSSPWSGRRAPHWFDEEVRELGYADAVFVLSAHDRWLLSLHGIEADVLPYYPPNDVERRLLDLRRRRASMPGADMRLLALGTAGSEPTTRGFLDLARLLAGDARLRSIAKSVVVAGYETETLRPAFAESGAEVLGTIPEGQLDDLQLRARALLVHYVPAPGALTRIPEALVAGIPVVANRHAARGYETAAGVHVYDGPAELLEILDGELPAPPRMPRPVAAEDRFVSQVTLHHAREGPRRGTR